MYWLIIILKLTIASIKWLPCIILVHRLVHLTVVLLISLVLQVTVLFLLIRIYRCIHIILLLNILLIDLIRDSFIFKKWTWRYWFIGCIIETIVNAKTALTISLCFAVRVELKFSICLIIFILIINLYKSIFILRFFGL